MRAALLSLAVILTLIPGPAAPQDSTGVDAYRAELRVLAGEEGSWWHASNAAYAEADGVDAYGTRFWVEPGGLSAGGCLWRIADGEADGVV